MDNKLILLNVIVALGLAITSCVTPKKEAQPQLNSNDTKAVLATHALPIELLVSTYRQQHADSDLDSIKIVSTFKWFLEVHDAKGKFAGMNPCRIQPIYAYGIEGVAYYEIWFKDLAGAYKGWVLLSATDKDYPLVNYSYGVPHSSRVLKGDSEKGKVYRFGINYFVLDDNGTQIASYGEMPSYVINRKSDINGSVSYDSKNPQNNIIVASQQPIEGKDYFLIKDYEALKTLFPKYYYDEGRQIDASEMRKDMNSKGTSKGLESSRTAEVYNEVTIPGDIGHYTQMLPNESPNNTNCYSGCNNNAWANIFLWWDLNAGKSNLIPTTSGGNPSPINRTTPENRAVVDPIQMYCRNVCGTYCSSGAGYTFYWNSHYGSMYAGTKGYAYTYGANWCYLWGGCSAGIANNITDGVANNQKPVLVGTSSHMLVAIGWKQEIGNTQNTWALCDPGYRDDNLQKDWIYWKDLLYSCKFFVY